MTWQNFLGWCGSCEPKGLSAGWTRGPCSSVTSQSDRHRRALLFLWEPHVLLILTFFAPSSVADVLRCFTSTQLMLHFLLVITFACDDQNADNIYGQSFVRNEACGLVRKQERTHSGFDSQEEPHSSEGSRDPVLFKSDRSDDLIWVADLTKNFTPERATPVRTSSRKETMDFLE